MPWPAALSDRLGLRWPIVQGPFGGGLSSVALASAVSRAGGLGSYGAHLLEGASIEEIARELRAEGATAFALNLWIPTPGEPTPAEVAEAWALASAALAPRFEALGLPLPPLPERFLPPFEAQFEALLEARPAVFSFVYGVPSPAQLAACRARGIFTLGTATHLAEAEALEAAGVDGVVLSGAEAGGHRASFLLPPEASPSLACLMREAAPRLSCPWVAAGGLAEARGLLSAFLQGASGVQLGSAFLACEESGANAAHRAALWAPGPKPTRLSAAFTGRQARCLDLPEARALGEARLPYPAQQALLLPLRQEAARRGSTEGLAPWAGQGLAHLRHRQAQALVAALVAETEALAGVWASRLRGA